MPLKVVLQTIDGKRFDEALPPNAALNRILPFGNNTFPLLQFIDPYGDTIFNGIQMRAFLPEWSQLTYCVTDGEESEFMLKVRAMAERCKHEPHVLLRFVGD
jgi:hypothetical protein